MIFTEPRDPRLIAVRRGGTLSDFHHRLLAAWAATCAEHVVHIFERASPNDTRVRHAIEQARAWSRGELRTRQALRASNAGAAARDVDGAARFAAYAAAQAVAVAHVAAHELGAAAYAIRAVRSDAPLADSEMAGRRECHWQRQQLPNEIRELVLDDQRFRNEACWFVFDC